MLAGWKLTQLVQKKVQTLLFLKKPHLTRVDWVQDLKQSILFGLVSMGNTSNNCWALNFRFEVPSEITRVIGFLHQNEPCAPGLCMGTHRINKPITHPPGLCKASPPPPKASRRESPHQ